MLNVALAAYALGLAVHIDWDKLVPAATRQPDTWAVDRATDDPQSALAVESLMPGNAFRSLPVRNLAESAAIDAAIDVGGILWPGMFTLSDMHSRLTGIE